MKDIVRQALNKDRALSDAGVERILDKKLGAPGVLTDCSTLWSLTDLGLGEVRQVTEAPAENRVHLRHLLGQGRLREAWSIEKAGMSFAAKMSLLSESLNEQKLYSLFAAEEARHFHCIDETLGDQRPQHTDPFIDLLNEIIVSAGRRPLIFIIQVVLEGWGIDHYATMSKTCREPGLQKILRDILSDEAAHHGSGLALFKESELSKQEEDYIFDMMAAFLGMVRIGPVGVLGAIEAEFGGWAPGQRESVLTEMNAMADTQRKLGLIEGFLVKARAPKLLERLKAAEAFSPCF